MQLVLHRVLLSQSLVLNDVELSHYKRMTTVSLRPETTFPMWEHILQSLHSELLAQNVDTATEAPASADLRPYPGKLL